MSEKRICRKCKHYQYNRGVLECGKAKHTKTTYSDGKEIIWYSLCDKINVDGECSMYEYQPTIWEQVRPWFQKYHWILWLFLGALIFQLIAKIWIYSLWESK